MYVIKNNLNLKEKLPMALSPNYNLKTAQLLADACALTYVQYANQFPNGVYNPKYDGTITLPDQFKNYRQTASFTAPEITGNDKDLKKRLSSLDLTKIDLTNHTVIENLAAGLKKVYFGFALEATDGSGNCIMALRGTQTPMEWLSDLMFIQVPVPLVWFKNRKPEVARAHFGFLFLYAFLFDQIRRAGDNLQNVKTCCVTGHSLGGALSVLAALTLGLITFPLGGKTGKVQMYSFAGPRVGDPVFCDIYNDFIPFSYRIVNLADAVPMVPPSTIFKYKYQHVGNQTQEWSYLNQTGDVGGNHSLQNNYTPALQANVVTNAKRVYPVSGLGGTINTLISRIKHDG